MKNNNQACSHSLASIQCELLLYHFEKPKSDATFRQCLKSELPAPKHRQRKDIEKSRPNRRAWYLDENTFVSQGTGAAQTVRLQSDSVCNSESFKRYLNSLVQACKTTYECSSELIERKMSVTHRFGFVPHDCSSFDLRKYFNIVPSTPADLQRESDYLRPGDVQLTFYDEGRQIQIKLSCSSVNYLSRSLVIDLTIMLTEDHIPPALMGFNSATSADRAFELFERLLLQITTPKLRQLLRWDEVSKAPR